MSSPDNPNLYYPYGEFPSKESRVLQIFQEANTTQYGHFLYASGRHGREYIEKSEFLRYPRYARELAETIAEDFKGINIDTVIGPAMGAITLAFITAECLDLDGNIVGVYAEKNPVNGNLFLPKKFYKNVAGKAVLVIEDVINSSKSVGQVCELVEANGGILVGVGSVCNRGDKHDVNGIPIFALYNRPMESFHPEECPLCNQGIPIDQDVGRGAIND